MMAAFEPHRQIASHALYVYIMKIVLFCSRQMLLLKSTNNINFPNAIFTTTSALKKWNKKEAQQYK